MVEPQTLTLASVGSDVTDEDVVLVHSRNAMESMTPVTSNSAQNRKVFAFSCVALALVMALVMAFSAIASKIDKAESTSAAPATNAPLHAVMVKRPGGTPKVAMGLTNHHGEAVTVSCATCHATTRPNIETRAAAELDQFHQGLKYAHGNLTCLSCHNANDYDTLRMADSRPVAFENVITLCSQCHGPQRRDYDMGLHGGMNGHWDLTKGGRTRNTCVNCHDPHSPAYPLVQPVFPPKDRISVSAKRQAEPSKH